MFLTETPKFHVVLPAYIDFCSYARSHFHMQIFHGNSLEKEYMNSQEKKIFLQILDFVSISSLVFRIYRVVGFDHLVHSFILLGGNDPNAIALHTSYADSL